MRQAHDIAMGHHAIHDELQGVLSEEGEVISKGTYVVAILCYLSQFACMGAHGTSSLSNPCPC